MPSLYYAEGLPYVAIITMSVVMYKNMGMSNTEIAFYTSLFYIAWVVKPLWSPFVDIIKSKRWWILNTQFLLGIGLVLLALFIPTIYYIPATICLFWILAFSSATHDIAADGFYLLGLNAEKQSFFVGIRNTAYRLAILTGQGILIYLAGILEKQTGNVPLSWTLTYLFTGAIMILLGIYHSRSLPRPEEDRLNKTTDYKAIWKDFVLTFTSFFQKKGIVAALFFLLTYRFSEAQLLKLIQPFMLDSIEKGGLGLDTSEVGLIYGVYGLIGLLLGGILGGILASKGGLKKWLWPMLLTMLITSVVFVYLAYTQTTNWYIISICIFVEQFGYGFGFTAYTLFMISFSKGEHKTSHYAICTGFMALGMMLPGMVAGKIEESLGGYMPFFIYVMICSIVPVIAALFVKTEDS